jgi:hypothetical protein
MRSIMKKPYEAPAIRASGHFVEQTRRNLISPQEVDDLHEMNSAGSVGFAL